MGIRIHGHLFKPIESDRPHHMLWRVYGSRQAFERESGRLAPLPATWEFVAEFKLKRARGKVGFPDFELEPTVATNTDGWKFYNLVPVDGEGKEIWHKDNELTLPADLPEEFEGELDVGSWLLWNLNQSLQDWHT